MYAVSDRYPNALRAGGATQYVTCAAYLNNTIISGAEDLPIVSGTVTDDSEPGVRRQLSLEVLPVPGLFDKLAPVGVQLRPLSVLRYPNGATETVPMGVFDLTQVQRGYGADGSIRLSGMDKWVLIQRARFLTPRASTPTFTVTQQIISLLQDVLGAGATVVSTATSQATVGSLVWDQDRDKAIMELAESIGAWVYFDRSGVPTIADLPAYGASSAAVWTVDSSARGVLLTADRQRDREKTYNVVVVNSQDSDGSALFAPQILQDQEVSSPTNVSGPFGQVPYFYSSPLLQNAAQAQTAGRAILARVTGLNAQMSLTSIRNHALDALDPIDVLLPQERYDIPRPVERHLISKVVHPLTPSGAQQIDTRATRADAV